MRCLLQIVLVAFLAVTAGSAMAEIEPPVPEQAEAQRREPPPAGPVQMVRTLQLMQDQIAAGSIEAHQAQRGLLTMLDDRFMEFEPETWRVSENAQAAVVFALSGGKPQILRTILALGPGVLPKDDIPLIEGALAYVEGREEEARRALLPINPQSLPVSLSGQIALVQSALVIRTDPVKSVELLDYVRLQAPGTLLEEAALRRQIFVASQINNPRKFESLVAQYLHRYRHSVYAGNFRQRLASALTRIDFGKDPSRFERTAAIMSELEPVVRRELYLLAARSSIENGLTKSALLLADAALQLSGQDAASAAKAKLYRAAALIVSPEDLEIATKDLQTLNRSMLTDSDFVLLNSALAMADQIRRMPISSTAETPVKSPSTNVMGKTAQEPGSAEAPQALQASEQPAAVVKAHDALIRIDKLIKTTTR